MKWLSIPINFLPSRNNSIVRFSIDKLDFHTNSSNQRSRFQQTCDSASTLDNVSTEKLNFPHQNSTKQLKTIRGWWTSIDKRPCLQFAMLLMFTTVSQHILLINKIPSDLRGSERRANFYIFIHQLHPVYPLAGFTISRLLASCPRHFMMPPKNSIASTVK